MKYLSILLIIVLSSCGHYSDGTSIYAKGGWIPVALGIAGLIIAIIIGIVSYNSGTHHQSQVGDGGPGGWKEDKGKKVSSWAWVVGIASIGLLAWYIIDKMTTI